MHEIYKTNFAGVTPGWHRIGVPLAAGTTADEAMELAGQKDWNVKSVPLVLDGVDTKGMYILLRKDGDVVQIASDQLVEHSYTTISNEEVFGPMVELMTGESLKVDCAGVLGRLGNRAFMTFDAGHIEVEGSEKYDQYMVGLANHSGRDSSRLLSTAIRVVCANTEKAARDGAKRMLVIAHNRASIDRFYNDADAGRKVLGLVRHYRLNLEEMAGDLQKIPFDGPMIAETVRQYKYSLGRPETPMQQTNRANAVDNLKGSFEIEMMRASQLGQQDVSLWTAKQAVSTYVQHESRGGPVMRAKRSMKIAEGIEPKMMTDLNKILFNVTEAMTSAEPGQVAKALQWIGN